MCRNAFLNFAHGTRYVGGISLSKSNLILSTKKLLSKYGVLKTELKLLNFHANEWNAKYLTFYYTYYK